MDFGWVYVISVSGIGFKFRYFFNLRRIVFFERNGLRCMLICFRLEIIE